MTGADDPRKLATRKWFGYGRWDAPYWFIGMEPGGSDEQAWYETWLRLGGDELCDCRLHHLGTDYTKWHDAQHPSPQPTWIPLIQLLLGFQGKPASRTAACAYQRDKWGALDGETALLEISAIRAKNLCTPVDRDLHKEQRINILAERLARWRPDFVLFYGKVYREIYERIAGVPFDANGFARQGGTLCALVSHPTARSNPAEMRSDSWWSAKGRDMRLLQAQASVARMPMSTPAVPMPRSAQSGVRPHGNTKATALQRISPRPTDIIRVLVYENPKLFTSKSRHRFDCYRDGMTVADYETAVRRKLGDAEARKLKADLQWDCHRNFIRLERDNRPVEMPILPSTQGT